VAQDLDWPGIWCLAVWAHSVATITGEIFNMTTGVSGLDASIQKTAEWLDDVKAELGWDNQQKAYQALRGTLHALRDRLPPEEAVHLGAQLPMLIRGLYFEGWTAVRKPHKRGREDFLAAVRSAFGAREPDPADVVRAVLRVLRRRVTGGEMADVRGCLPAELQDLWDRAHDDAA
jgi:uncharacterized protein (DUF2267 family)